MDWSGWRMLTNEKHSAIFSEKPDFLKQTNWDILYRSITTQLSLLISKWGPGHLAGQIIFYLSRGQPKRSFSKGNPTQNGLIDSSYSGFIYNKLPRFRESWFATTQAITPELLRRARQCHLVPQKTCRFFFGECGSDTNEDVGYVTRRQLRY